MSEPCLNCGETSDDWLFAQSSPAGTTVCSFQCEIQIYREQDDPQIEERKKAVEDIISTAEHAAKSLLDPLLNSLEGAYNALWAAYRRSGAPYGLTREDFHRWLGELDSYMENPP